MENNTYEVEVIDSIPVVDDVEVTEKSGLSVGKLAIGAIAGVACGLAVSKTIKKIKAKRRAKAEALAEVEVEAESTDDEAKVDEE